jgi:glutamate 5-kinase
VEPRRLAATLDHLRWQRRRDTGRHHGHGASARTVTRQVIKLGSSSIASGDGLALDVIAGLVSQVAAVQRAGHEIILVTSGAARLGRRLLSFEGPTAGAVPALRALVSSVRSSMREAADLGQAARDTASGAATAVTAGDYGRLIGSLQETLRRYESAEQMPQAIDVALPASVGQPALMAMYRQLAAAVGIEVCQILVSRSDLASARAMSDLGSLLNEALGRGLLPVVNGNDATDPVSALDNDQVAVAISVAAGASRLLFLTDVRAAYRDLAFSDRIPRLTPDEARAVRITAGGAGRGGMGSKLDAAARAACCGIECVIGSAREPDVVARSINPRARLGTVVRAARSSLEPSQRWIGGMAYSAGSIYVNKDAEQSLRTGSTLFLSGVKRVDGEFSAGSVVELLDVRHPERLIGRGSVALPSSILRLLRALSPQEVACAISILLRLRHAPGPLARTGAGDRAAAAAALADPGKFEDCRELAAGSSTASREALAQLAGSSADRIGELADSFMLTQPQLCAVILLDRGFMLGHVPGEPAARRAFRNIHAVHRESLVVYPPGR